MIRSVFVSTVPFGGAPAETLEALAAAGIAVKINPTGRRLKAEELGPFLAGCDAMIAGTEPITPQALDAAPDLKLIARVGVGLDNVPFDEAARRGVAVSWTPDAPTRAVAELTVGLALDGLRRFTHVDRAMRQGEWRKHMGGLLHGRTVGLVGVGRIGKSAARLLAAFGARILGHDPVQDPEFSVPGFSYVSLDRLLAESDIVSLHVSLTPGSRGLINAGTLSRMKPSAFLINTSRGPVVDETALHAALQEGRLAGAALDVFCDEPYGGPFAGLDNVILTSHIGAATLESRAAMEREAVEDVLRFHRGEPLRHPVTSA